MKKSPIALYIHSSVEFSQKEEVEEMSKAGLASYYRAPLLPDSN